MNKILIIYPHWYPSNLAGVHRARLVGNYLHELGWKPIILTVKPDYYEETPDPEIQQLFSQHFVEYRVDAMKIGKLRIFGDIGLRAFWQLYNKAKEIIKVEKPDFLWIPIPSFYTALLGRILHNKTAIPYGIDYIDPWVRDISKDRSFRAKLSLVLAKIMEPIAIKKASLITGVAFEYFKPVLDKNFKSGNFYNIKFAAFPYGFDPNDHKIELSNIKVPWDNNPGCIPIVYAGAFMPNSQFFLKILFRAFSALVKENKIPKNVHLYFLGTGFYPHKSVTENALNHEISEYVTEIQDRFPFLHILNFLAKAEKLLIIGSTEKHYTASKTYQVILSNRPFLGMFHHQSTAVNVLKETNTDSYLVKFNPEKLDDQFYESTKKVLLDFLLENKSWNPDLKMLEPYAAKQSAKILVDAMEKALMQNY